MQDAARQAGKTLKKPHRENAATNRKTFKQIRGKKEPIQVIDRQSDNLTNKTGVRLLYACTRMSSSVSMLKL